MIKEPTGKKLGLVKFLSAVAYHFGMARLEISANLRATNYSLYIPVERTEPLTSKIIKPPLLGGGVLISDDVSCAPYRHMTTQL